MIPLGETFRMRWLPPSAMNRLPAASTATLPRTVQLGAGGGPSITGKARRAITRHRGDDPFWGDLADAVVARDEQVARAVHRHATRLNLRGGGWSAVSGEAAGVAAIADHRGNDPVGETLRMRLE